MMDMLMADLSKNIQELEFTEKDGQGEYETFVKDSATMRASHSKDVADKEAAKAGLEADVLKATEEKDGATQELMATKQYLAELHADCDWLLSKYEARKSARADEVDALKNAKA